VVAYDHVSRDTLRQRRADKPRGHPWKSYAHETNIISPSLTALHQIEETSTKFDRFLELMGDKIKLEGWKDYRGDLDVVHGGTGEFSVYTKLENIEVTSYESQPFSVPIHNLIMAGHVSCVYLPSV